MPDPVAEPAERAAATAQPATAAPERKVPFQLGERHFRAMIENGLDLVSILDANGIILYASPSHERVLGYRPDDLVGRGAFDLVHPDDAGRILETFADGLTDPGRVATLEFRYRHNDGSWRVIESIGSHPLPDEGVGGFVIHSRDVTERRAAEDRTAVLLDVARDLASTLDPAEILDRVQRRIAAVLPCDIVTTYRWNPDEERFRLASQFGMSPEAVEQVRHLSFGATEPFDGRLYSGAVIVNDAAAQPGPMRELARRFGFSALIAAPLRVPGRYFGSLCAYRAAPGRPFDDGHAQLCTAIGSQLAVALERVELYRTEREAAEVFGALARVGRELLGSLDLPGLTDRLCRITSEVLGCEIAQTLLWRPAEQAFSVVAAHGIPADELDALGLVRIPGSAIADALGPLGDEGVAPLVGTVEASAAGLGTLARGGGVGPRLVVALRRGAEIVGLLVASRSAEHGPFQTSEIRIGQGLAQLASLALEHARIVDELDAANRLKSEFVAMMSHELRTPLNAIIGYGDLLREGAFGDLDREQGEVLDRIGRSSRELHRLISDVLDLSRLESGRVPLRQARVAISDLVAELAVELEHLERAPAVALQFDVATALPDVTTDAAKLKVVLRNLVLNALKFTDEGAVSLSAAPEDDGVVLRVVDTGMGIAPDQLGIIFEPFRQAHTAARRQGGVGLGLYIVRRIIDMLGGTVSVESDLGRGSTFRVWVPAATEEAPHAGAEPLRAS
ncbi:MAG TPA: ATP-binding protein [Candidatus Binatia bacterium]|nr:ATP-binding protein [Candidatus Binatia bacterium]